MDNVFIDGMGESVAPQQVTTAETYAALVRRTGLVDDTVLDAALTRFAASPKERKGRNEAAGLAYFLLQNKVLSAWQTKMILQGRWRGFLLGKYRLLDRIGTGGMSSVFLAEHPLMKRKVAIKVLPRSSHEKDSRVRRFLKEAELVSSLDHPNVVKAYHFDAEHDRYYLVMEYIEGTNLQQKVDREGPLDFSLAADYMRQACAGLAYAHSAGLIHRDVKPANLLVDREGVIKVLDLGLARSMAPNATSYTQDRTSKVLGTADYVAPEQVKDSHDVDARTDIYSLGCTLYFLLAGRAPFSEGNLANKLAMHLYHQPESLREQRAETPLALERICLRMMSKNREDRYQSAEEVASVLARWLENAHESDSLNTSKEAEGIPSPNGGDETAFRDDAHTDTNLVPKTAIAVLAASPTNVESLTPSSIEAKQAPLSENSETELIPPIAADLPSGAINGSAPRTKEADPSAAGNERSSVEIDLTGGNGEAQSKSGSGTKKRKKKRRPPAVMTLREVSRYLRFPATQVEALAQQGKMPAQEIMGEWRFHREAIDRWLQQNDLSSQTWMSLKGDLSGSEGSVSIPPESEASPPPRPGEALRPGRPLPSSVPPETVATSASALERRSKASGLVADFEDSVGLEPSMGIDSSGGGSSEMDPNLEDLLVSLEETGLLSEDALESVRGQILGGRLSEVGAALHWLRQLGWLSDYQVAVLRQGRTTGLRYGDYVVIERIGAGGMAVVYKARNRSTGQIVALKVMQHDSAKSAEEEAKRFDREVRAVAKLNHPNIVAAWDAVSSNRESYLVLEYVDGDNLDQRVRHGGPLSVAEAVDYLLQVAQGLQHAHSKQMVHRDVKPGNLLVDTRGTIKILDLGLVRFDFTLGGVAGSLMQPLTTQDTVLGTPDFMAPEQFADARSADNRADIYSLGCTLYFMLTGQSPFERGSPTRTLQAHQTEAAPKLTDVCPQAPQALQMVFEKMVAKSPRQRYQSMDDIIADIEEYVLPLVGPSSGALEAGRRMIAARSMKNDNTPPTSAARRPTVVRRGDSPTPATPALNRLRVKSPFRGANKLLIGTSIGAVAGVVLGGVATMMQWSLADKLVELCAGVPVPPIVLMAGLGAVFWGGVGFLIAELTSSSSGGNRT